MEPNPENKKVVGQFIFFGDNGAALTGKDAVLLAAHTKGRPDYIPPAIGNIVGKTCAVTADVKQDTLDADDGLIIFSVSRVDLIVTSAQEIPSSSQSIKSTSSHPTTLSVTVGSRKNKELEATPVKDVIEQPSPGKKEVFAIDHSS